MSDLKNKVKRHFDQVELSDTQFEKFNSIMLNERKAKSSLVNWLKILVPTFTLLIVFFVTNPFVSLENKVMDEIVRNHLKKMPSEIVTESLAAAEHRLDKLDFSLISSVHTKDMKLIGARYCSIQGIIAAQLKYEDNDGNRYTVYQVPLQDAFKYIHGKIDTSTIKGVDVNLYAENGILVGMAISI